MKPFIASILLLVNIPVFAQVVTSTYVPFNRRPPNYYTIKSTSDPNYLSVTDNVANLKGQYINSSQVWKIEKQANETYTITNAVSGKSLDESPTTTSSRDNMVVTNTINKISKQTWRITEVSGGYKISIEKSGKVLSSYTENSVILTNTTKGNQVFIITPSTVIVKTPLFTDLRANQTPYKNQTEPSGERGGCTYFGSMAALEAAYKKRGYGTLDLSEEFMAITSKMFYLHPRWSEITTPNFRENQFAGTQGGGSIAFLAHGLKIPAETIVPYGGYTISPDWDNKDLKVCNDFNFSVLKRYANIRSKTTTYYGVKGFKTIPVINGDNLEKVLLEGNEIKISIDGGSHCVLFVGFDKTNPADKQFIVKDSYNTHNMPCTEKLQYFSYSDMARLISAEYITDVTEPGTWDEVKLFGRWNLKYGGWTGILDIFHLPGIMKPLLSNPDIVSANGGEIPDRRIGVFYDAWGKAHRVNGSIKKTLLPKKEIEITFYIDNSKPNLRWDELSGRKFVYTLSFDGNTLSGYHIDLDGKRFEGAATRQ